MTIRERWKKTSLPNQLLVIIGLMAALFTGLYAGATVIQICLLRESARQATEQTERVIGEAKHIADSVRDSVAQSRDAMNASAEQNKTALEASAQQGKAALDASIEALRTDQRAWVGITEAATPQTIKEGSKLNTDITLANSGKTPALDVIQIGGWRLIPSSDALDVEHEVSTITPSRQGVVQPGGKRILGTRTGTVLTKQQAEGLLNHSMTFYVFGRITYMDVFKAPHWTKFCITLDIADPAMGFAPCKTYNDAN